MNEKRLLSSHEPALPLQSIAVSETHLLWKSTMVQLPLPSMVCTLSQFATLTAVFTVLSTPDAQRPRKRVRTESGPSQPAQSMSAPSAASAKRSAPVATPAAASTSAGAGGVTVRERLIHLLAPMPNGCGGGTIARRLAMPINRFRNVLASVATYEVGGEILLSACPLSSHTQCVSIAQRCTS